MTLIVARKEASSIMIVGDTKLSMPEERRGDRNDKIGLPSSGVIKIAIINPNISVSFAGGEQYAEEALQKIYSDTPISSILDTLIATHLDSNEVTDFIVAIGGEFPKLFEIKESRCNEVEAAWIGSKDAFSLFQAFVNGEVKSQRNNYFHIEPVPAKNNGPLFGMMSKAMDHVIDSEQIPEVGGFRVNAVFDDGKFQYVGYTHSYFSERPITVTLPKGVKSFSFPIPHGTADNGGYIINFFRSEDTRHAGLHIPQGNFGIIYKRENGGLMRPTIVSEMDEVDFVDYAEDNFGISASMLTQSRSQKCLAAGDELAEKHSFEAALMWYDKALRKCWGKERAVFYYRKAVTLANLQRYREVPAILQEAVKSDSNYQKLAFELMIKIQRRHAK